MGNWLKNVRTVEPYVPGEQPNQPDMVKLNTNENPYPPSPKVGEALAALEADKMRLYPDPTAKELINAIADFYEVKPSQVYVGVGSDDVIAMSFLTFFNDPEGKPVLFPEISYSFYDVWADCFRIPYEMVKLNDDFSIDPDSLKKPNGGVIFPNPNAPTGLALPVDTIEEIVKANPDSVVIVDEAYVDFGTESALRLLPKYENLLIVQTFSKSRSLAGMRIGFAIGNEKLISCLMNVRNSFNSYTMNRPAIAAGTAAIKDKKYFDETRKKIIDTREWAKGELTKLGFTYPDSKANFIFATHRSVPAKEIFDRLREKHIYVRYFNKPGIDNYLRITIGTKEQMQKLFSALREILGL
ncbi:MAG: histidinol-phosphate transaminase [Eubacteriales bacterium]|jgi:histidinol-phosphate aminotransferase